MEKESKQFAVLIDADNAQASVLESILNEISLMGDATVKRIYGDFTNPQSSCWKHLLQKNAIKPIQQFAYTTGKNATEEGANKRGNSPRLTQSFHFFMFEPIFSPVNALNQPI